MKRSCDQFRPLIAQAVQGELDESTRAEVLGHAGACPECADCLRFQTRLHAAITQDPAASPPPVYFEGVLAEIHRKMPVLPARRALRCRRLEPQVVATAMLAALLFIWIGAGVITSLPTGARPGTNRPQDRALQVASVPAPPRPMMLVKGYGLVLADSELVKMSPAQRRELGLPDQEFKFSTSHVSKG